MAEQTPCRECKGTGVLQSLTVGVPTATETCPWCEGTGKVEVSYVVYAHGYNGDCTFMEPWAVEPSLVKAKEVATRVMLRDRLANRLADGSPTITWMEVFGPGIEESLGLEDHGGGLLWVGV